METAPGAHNTYPASSRAAPALLSDVVCDSSGVGDGSGTAEDSEGCDVSDDCCLSAPRLSDGIGRVGVAGLRREHIYRISTMLAPVAKPIRWPERPLVHKAPNNATCDHLPTPLAPHCTQAQVNFGPTPALTWKGHPSQ